MGETQTTEKAMPYEEVADGEMRVRVYPCSFPVLMEHTQEISEVLRALGTIDFAKAQANGVDAAAIWWALAPVAGRQLLRLVSDCCRPSLAEVDAPVGLVAQAAAAWLKLSFLSGGLDQIKSAALALLATFGSGGANGRTMKLSPNSSASATPPPTSSTASGATATRSGDGLSPNSSGTPAPLDG
jgi:hypothetical protein